MAIRAIDAKIQRLNARRELLLLELDVASVRRGGRLSDEQYAELFWSLVAKGPDCWMWLGKVSRAKSMIRGSFSVRAKKWFAHRYSWKLAHGEDPGGLCVCHTCDNPLCVRPEHLFLGTTQDNVADMDRKGRRVSVRGERCGSARLTADKVREVRARAAAGESHAALGRAFGLASGASVRRIVLRETWKHVG